MALKYLAYYYQKDTFNNRSGQNHHHWFGVLFPNILMADSKQIQGECGSNVLEKENWKEDSASA